MVRREQGDVECVLCGRRCDSFTKHPVCWDCVYWMHEDGANNGYSLAQVMTRPEKTYENWHTEKPAGA
jgi:hypothetical protein